MLPQHAQFRRVGTAMEIQQHGVFDADPADEQPLLYTSFETSNASGHGLAANSLRLFARADRGISTINVGMKPNYARIDNVCRKIGNVDRQRFN